MKEYVDQKFWKMFSGFATIIVASITLLFVIGMYKNKEVSAKNSTTKPITTNQ